MKTLREMKRDIEATICSRNDRQSGNGSDAWKTRGLFSWTASGRDTVNTDTLGSRATPADIPADYATPQEQDINAAGNLTEGDLNGVLQSLYQTHSAKKTYMGVFGPEVVEKIDNFTRLESASGYSRYTINDQAVKKTINLEVKIFNSSFGRVNVMPSVFLDHNGTTFNTEVGLLLDLDLLELQYMEPLTVHNMDDEGGGPRGFAKTIYSLCCKNPKGLAAIDNGTGGS
jgi:hypothetical protein